MIFMSKAFALIFPFFESLVCSSLLFSSSETLLYKSIEFFGFENNISFLFLNSSCVSGSFEVIVGIPIAILSITDKGFDSVAFKFG